MIQVVDAFPDLRKYQGCWPVNDLMIMHLKNTSRRERLKTERALGAGTAQSEGDKQEKGKQKENLESESEDAELPEQSQKKRQSGRK